MDKNKFQFDGREYSTSSLTDKSKNILVQLKQLENELNEKKNMLAVLTKAKRSYISDLKSEMLSAKAGLDFLD